MKYFIVHDDDGKILSVGSPAPGHAPKVGVRPRAGQHVHLVDSVELQGTHPHQVRQFIEQYQIDVRSSPPKLVRRH